MVVNSSTELEGGKVVLGTIQLDNWSSCPGYFLGSTWDQCYKFRIKVLVTQRDSPEIWDCPKRSSMAGPFQWLRFTFFLPQCFIGKKDGSYF